MLILPSSVPGLKVVTRFGTGILGATTGAAGGGLFQSPELPQAWWAMAAARPGEAASPSVSLVVLSGLEARCS